MKNWLILVPARFESSRFPGKPLAKINNKPMIHYIVENCTQSGFDFAIVTDNAEIEACVREISDKVVRIDDNVPSGTERIALAYQRYFKESNYDYVINVQGDEPLLKGELIQKIAKDHGQTNFDIFTAVKKRSMTEEGFNNPNIVKAVYSEKSQQCLYFSRQSIPYAREEEMEYWFQHIGIYCYSVKALEKFVSVPMSKLENIEKLEQLRALENSMSIGASEVDVNLIGVDTPEDLKKVQGALIEK